VALNIAIEDVHDAATETHDLVVIIVVGVDGAFAFLDGGMVRCLFCTILTERSQCGRCAIEVDGVFVQV
jgi:hypothetical protein